MDGLQCLYQLRRSALLLFLAEHEELLGQAVVVGKLQIRILPQLVEEWVLQRLHRRQSRLRIVFKELTDQIGGFHVVAVHLSLRSLEYLLPVVCLYDREAELRVVRVHC